MSSSGCSASKRATATAPIARSRPTPSPLPTSHDIAWWTSRFQLSPEIYLTTGEPFFNPNLPAIVEHLLDMGVMSLTIVTSGIDLSAPHERVSASEMGNLPADKKQRLLLRLSVSDFPRPADTTPLELQKAAFGFALENGIEINFLSFLGMQHVLDNIIFPFVSKLLVKSPSGEVVKSHRFYSSFFDRKGSLRTLGRYPLSSGLPYKDSIRPTGMCMARPGHCGPLFTEVTGDSMVSGCLSPLANLILFGNIGDPQDVIAERALGFRERLKSFSFKKSGQLDCLDCIQLASELGQMRGDWKQVQRVIGQKNLEFVKKGRVGDGFRLSINKTC